MTDPTALRKIAHDLRPPRLAVAAERLSRAKESAPHAQGVIGEHSSSRLKTQEVCMLTELCRPPGPHTSPPGDTPVGIGRPNATLRSAERAARTVADLRTLTKVVMPVSVTYTMTHVRPSAPKACPMNLRDGRARPRQPGCDDLAQRQDSSLLAPRREPETFRVEGSGMTRDCPIFGVTDSRSVS